MKIIDIIFAIISGQLIGLLALDFLGHSTISFSLYYGLIFFIFFPVFSVMCLYLAFVIGRKFLFIFQAAKHLLVGAFATVIDLKIFEILFWILPVSVAAKSISFLFSTALKYMGNKYWAFEKREKENMHKEAMQFFVITLVGLIIDIGVFYYATKIMGPQFEIPVVIWVKLSVIFAALAAAVWNFYGYKFLVFKK